MSHYLRSEQLIIHSQATISYLQDLQIAKLTINEFEDTITVKDEDDRTNNVKAHPDKVVSQQIIV